MENFFNDNNKNKIILNFKNEILFTFQKKDVYLYEIGKFYYDLILKNDFKQYDFTKKFNYSMNTNYMGYVYYFHNLNIFIKNQEYYNIYEILDNIEITFDILEPRIYYNLKEILEVFLWKELKNILKDK